MKAKKLKELLVFATVHRVPEVLPPAKREVLSGALMKLNTEELEIVEEFVGTLADSLKPTAIKRKGVEEEGLQEEKSA
ncbi:hypothetical protein [Pseudobacillus badius]|uniref:hypothetical protein n=1 Tax=Bacillus badius TaxID=1455 RepID=UPI0007B343CE|nr:hypothetical protein [Bacillus badius]KZR57925.1 hypothetical protein A3781_19300 [Bacillus badius]